MKNKTLMTDFYEYTMSQTYYNNDLQDEYVYFDVFFRTLPFGGGYLVSACIDNVVDYINNFKVNEEDIDYLKSQGVFGNEFLNYLKDLKFTGDIYGVPDGTIVFPNEPIITVRAKVIEAQLIETALLTNFNHGSLVMTKATRITEAANKRPVMEFGARRARGIDSAVEASKYAVMGGCAGTSNTLAGKKYNIPVMGTMAHSLVTFFGNEYDAFKYYAESNPENCIFLVDTYDTLRSGIPNAIKVAKDLNINFKGIRIDSGDLAYLSKQARKMLDEAGFPNTKICLSNGLDEYTITELINQGAVFDSIGVGDNIAASKERVGGVYKLTAVEANGIIDPRIKVSDDSIKTINPHYKKVYRFYDNKTGYALGDVITVYDEQINQDTYTLVHPIETWKKTILTDYTIKELQVPIFKEGKQVYQLPSINEVNEYRKQQLATIFPEIKRLTKPHGYYVDLSNKLRELKQQLIDLHQHEIVKEPVKRMGTYHE